MTKIRLIITVLGILAFSFAFTQDKFEKESRVKRADVPSSALKFVDSVGLKSRVKWFREEGLLQKSYEAKFRRNKIKYSVEFDSLGVLQDVEIDLSFEDLQENLRTEIMQEFISTCAGVKIIKVQKQISGSASEMLAFLINGSQTAHLVTKYEFIVSCTVKKKVDMYEYLFSDLGKKISILKIVLKNSSHLEY